MTGIARALGRRSLIALAGGLAAAIGVIEIGTGHARHAPASARTDALSPGYGTYFAVLATAQGTRGRLPAASRAALARSTRPSFDEASFAAARRVPSVTPAWLVPSSRGELCLVRLVYALVRGPGGVRLPPATQMLCATPETARSGGLVGTQSLSATAGGSEFEVLGVAADGVRSVTVASGDGRRTSAPVHGNAYALRVSDPVSLSFVTDLDGTSSERTIALETPRIG